VVVSGQDSVAFVRYDTGAVTQLDASDEATTNLPQRHLSCPSVSRQVAACITVAGYRFDSLNVFIDPLDGSPPLASSPNPPNPPVALGRTAAWPAHHRLVILSASPTRESKSKIAAGRDSTIAAEDGNFVADRPDATRAISIRRDGTTRGRVFATPSVTQAFGFTLTRDRILWKEDDRDGARTRSALMQRRISPSASGDRVNAASPQRRAWSKSTAMPIAAAGSTLVFVRRVTSRSGNSPLRTLRIETPAGRHTITGVTGNGIGIGDHRLLYFAATATALRGKLYNLKSHRTQSFDAVTGALSGHLLAYLTPDGRLLVRDLKAGGTTEVASGLDAQVSSDLANTEVFQAGRYVGWNTHGPQRSAYRIVDASSPTVTLPADEKIRTISATAIVTIKRIATGSFPGGGDLAFTPDEKFSLHTFGADQDSKLLAGSYFVAAPQVLGHVMAWIDPYGQLKARVLQ
jgi:hypothetical protein